MRLFLFLLAVLALLSGFGILSSAKSAIHEIEAFVLYIVSAVFFSGAAIVGAINRLAKKIEANPSSLYISKGGIQSEQFPDAQQSQPHSENSECETSFEKDFESVEPNPKVDYTDNFANKWKLGGK
jgi:hypothetical protein